MYQYDQLDQAFVDQRVSEFRDQTRRFLAGELSEDEFKGLRLRNGLYIQRHAPMLRIAIPYGLLASRQLRKLGEIARRLGQAGMQHAARYGCRHAARQHLEIYEALRGSLAHGARESNCQVPTLQACHPSC